MNKTFLPFILFLLIVVMLVGCSNTQKIESSATKPPAVDNTSEPSETTDTEGATEYAPAETEENTEYEGDASSYYIDVVYAQQIERYYSALSEQWSEDQYYDKGLSVLPSYYYDGNPLDNVGFAFMDLDGDGIWELIIGAIQNAEQDPLVFEIWTLKNDEPIMVAQSGHHNRYYLQYAEEDNLWSVAYEAENGAANRAIYYLQLLNGEFTVIQGVVFDALANVDAPWFMAYDLDWDVSNDMPIDENTANAVMKAGRSTYATTEYFPYCLYK